LEAAPPTTAATVLPIIEAALHREKQKKKTLTKTKTEEEEEAKHMREEEEQPSATTAVHSDSTTTATSTSSHQRCPVSFLLLLLLWSLSTVHVACEQWRVLHCSLGRTSSARSKMSGLGPAQSKKNSQKIF
jgi:hypothetical protein